MRNIKCIFLLIFCLILTGCVGDALQFCVNNPIFQPGFKVEDIYFEDDNKIVITYSGNRVDIDYVYIEANNKNYVKKVTYRIDYDQKKIFLTNFDINSLKNIIQIELYKKKYRGYCIISCEINEETGDIDFYDDTIDVYW
ncbi:MAG: hypothetical protein MJ188_04685 [Treponema sp.]|nr:hypothetical protein [Treponema sp.]